MAGESMLPAHPTPHDVETGPAPASGGAHAMNEKPGWFGRFGRQNETGMDGAGYATPPPAPAAGYGSSAYTGNY